MEEQIISREVAVYLFKGMHFGKKRLFIKEAAYYDKALKLAPLYAPLFLYRGRSLHMSGNPTEAIEDYTRAIDIDPKLAYAYYIRGLAYKKAELFDLALDDYNRAIELEEGFAMAYNNRGLLYLVTFGDKITGCRTGKWPASLECARTLRWPERTSTASKKPREFKYPTTSYYRPNLFIKRFSPCSSHF